MANLSTIFPLSIIFVILLFFSAFFSGVETAFISLNKLRLRNQLRKGTPKANIIYELAVKKIDRFITAVLISNNFINTCMSVLATIIFVTLFGAKWGPLLTTVVITLLIIIFGEAIPKIYSAQYSDKIAYLSVKPMSFLVKLLNPVVKVITVFSRQVIKKIGGEVKKRSPLVTEEELRLMIEIGKEEGVVEDDERKMLQRIFEFGDIHAKEIMTPIEKMIIVSIDASVQDLLKIIEEQGHSRVPLYHDYPENIVGIIHAQSLLSIREDSKLVELQDIIDKPYYVRESEKLSVILKNFQQHKIQIAIVRNQEEKATGLVTLEDVMEEIVGEIEEE